MRHVFPVSVLVLATAITLTIVARTTMVSGHSPSLTAAPSKHPMLGGPYGLVKQVVRGVEQPVDGLMVQLVSKDTSIRTTVYTNETGRFEFPQLPPADYVLRLARPLEFFPYVNESVRIQGATQLPDIEVKRRSQSEWLPPDEDLLAQLTGSEWLSNVSGTAHEKRLFTNGCGFSCHGGERPFNRRYDERGWWLVLDRMTNHGQRILITTNARATKMQLSPDAQMLAKWLARVQAPDSPTPNIVPFPRPKGPATRAIITEYELPWAMTNVHDVSGDARGQIYFSINRSPFIGRLDPATGKVTEFRIPDGPEPPVNDPRDRYTRPDGTNSSPTGKLHTNPPGVHPGLHWLQVDHHTGRVWFTETWSRSLAVLDPKTGEVRKVFTGMQGNNALAPDGKSVWRTHKGKILKFDTSTVMDTGMPVKTWDLKRTQATYGNFLSPDGRYFGGGAGWIVWLDTKTDEVREIPLEYGSENGRGSFDNEGNIWTGTETLNKYDPKTNAITMYYPPTPYFCAYSARVDKNGEIWAGQQSSGRVYRFNPKTHRWIEYVMPNPWSHDFNSWIDNSTTVPTFWYGDQHGYIVRIQPLE